MPVKSMRYVILRMYEEVLVAIMQFKSSMRSNEDIWTRSDCMRWRMTTDIAVHSRRGGGDHWELVIAVTGT